MKNYILLAASLIIVTICTAQKKFATGEWGSSGAKNSNYDIFSRTIDLNQKSLAFGMTEAEFNTIKDEAYLNANFLVGNIYQDDKLLKNNVPMRYNAYADEIEIKNHVAEENYGALIKDPSIYVKINQDIYVFIPYEDSNEKGGYFNILADGKAYDLYKKTTAVFLKPEKAQTSYQRDTPPSFDKTAKYYLVKEGTFYELPSSNAKLLNMMDSKKNEVKAYIKENNLDLEKEIELVKAITYFDSLL